MAGVTCLSGCEKNGPSEVGTSYSKMRKIVDQAKTLGPGRHPRHSLPAELRAPRLLEIRVVEGKGCSLEFSSKLTIDLDPAYVFVEGDPPDPEAVAREICEGSLSYRHKLSEKGWHYATGQ